MPPLEPKIKLRRGYGNAVPPPTGREWEPHYIIDRKAIKISDGSAFYTVVPMIETLAAISTIDKANDLLLIHDVSETSVPKEKKVTVANLRTAMNIPEASADEKVAVNEGATAGFLNEVLANTSQIEFHIGAPGGGPDANQMYAKISIIDCGEFGS